jgi:hypothetical protein
VNVDTIQKGARYFGPVFENLLMGAAAFMLGIGKIAAGMRMHKIPTRHLINIPSRYTYIHLSEDIRKSKSMTSDCLSRQLHTTSDVCQVLGMHPDTFRYRLRNGWYPETGRVEDKRRFTEEQIRDILKITNEIRNVSNI